MLILGDEPPLVRHLAGHRFEEILDGVHRETLVPVVEVEVGANLQRMPLQVGDLVLNQHVVEFGALVLGQVDEQDFGRLKVLPCGIRVFRVEKDVRKSQLVAAVGLEHEFVFGIVGRRRQVIDMFLETGDERDLRTAVHLVPRRAVVRPRRPSMTRGRTALRRRCRPAPPRPTIRACRPRSARRAIHDRLDAVLRADFGLEVGRKVVVKERRRVGRRRGADAADLHGAARGRQEMRLFIGTGAEERPR